jgi:hypothetical protein
VRITQSTQEQHFHLERIRFVDFIIINNIIIRIIIIIIIIIDITLH